MRIGTGTGVRNSLDPLEYKIKSVEFQSSAVSEPSRAEQSRAEQFSALKLESSRATCAVRAINQDPVNQSRRIGTGIELD